MQHTLRLKDTEDLVTSDETHLGDAVRVAKGDTDLGRSKTLASQLDNVLDNILWGGLQPFRGSTEVGEGGGR